MNRHFTTINARALSGAAALSCVNGLMPLGRSGRAAAGSRSPGRGDVASP